MKRLIYSLLCFFLPVISFAEGINFSNAKSLEEAIQKSKDEKLVLIVEMYREKCPACVKLEKLIFPSAYVGDELNDYIIVYRINGEQGKGIDIMKKYRVVAFPTLLFFKDGEFMERSIGSSFTPEEFVDRIHDLLKNHNVF